MARVAGEKGEKQVRGEQLVARVLDAASAELARVGPEHLSIESVRLRALPDGECAPTDAGVNRGDGDTIQVCLAGRPARVGCAAAGATCREEDAGARCLLAP